MKKLLLTLTFATSLLFSCKKENVEPSTSNQTTSQSTTRTSNSDVVCKVDSCVIKTDLTKLLLAGVRSGGKQWSIAYFDGTTNARLSVPGLISPTINNTFYWESNDSLKEFSYQGYLIDTGIWTLTNCGGTAVINTTLSGGNNPFTLEVVKFNYWQGSFYLPLGPGGTLVLVRVRAYAV